MRVHDGSEKLNVCASIALQCGQGRQLGAPLKSLPPATALAILETPWGGS